MANIKTGVPTRNPGAVKPKSGGTQPIQNGGKGSKGVTNDALMRMGRNLARVANQKG